MYAVVTAFLAGLVTLFTWNINGFIIKGSNTPFTYISFCAWAVYFLVGASPKAALKAFSSMIAGIIAAILMFVLSLAFGFTPWYAVPLAVVILVIPMMLMESVKPFNNVSAVFVGTGLYFSLSASGAIPSFDFFGYTRAGLAELFYVLVGFVAGWLTIQLRAFAAGEKQAEKNHAVPISPSAKDSRI
ncbi:MAG: DUF1097 domain-containing protein [Ethanoligenens sp.]